MSVEGRGTRRGTQRRGAQHDGSRFRQPPKAGPQPEKVRPPSTLPAFPLPFCRSLHLTAPTYRTASFSPSPSPPLLCRSRSITAPTLSQGRATAGACRRTTTASCLATASWAYKVRPQAGGWGQCMRQLPRVPLTQLPAPCPPPTPASPPSASPPAATYTCMQDDNPCNYSPTVSSSYCQVSTVRCAVVGGAPPGGAAPRAAHEIAPGRKVHGGSLHRVACSGGHSASPGPLHQRTLQPSDPPPRQTACNNDAQDCSQVAGLEGHPLAARACGLFRRSQPACT